MIGREVAGKMSLYNRVDALERSIPAGRGGIDPVRWAAISDEDVRFLAGLPDNQERLSLLARSVKARAEELCRHLDGGA